MRLRTLSATCLVGVGLGLIALVFYAHVGRRTAAGLDDVERLEGLRSRLGEIDAALATLRSGPLDAGVLEAAEAEALAIAADLEGFGEPAARSGSEALAGLAATAREAAASSEAPPDLAAIGHRLAADLGRATAAVDRLLAERRGSIERILIRSVVTLMVVALLAAVLGLFAFGIVYRRIGRPVAEIRQGLEAVAAGDLATRLPVPREDEIGELAAAFNRTVERLERAEAERRAAEEDLERTKRQLERAQHVAHLGSWELDLSSGEVTWSGEVYELFGLEPGAFDGTEEAFFELVAPEYHDRFFAARERLLAGEGEIDLRHPIVHPNGEVHWFQVRGQLLGGDDGEPRRIIGTVQDITGIHLAEEESARLRQRLAQASRLEAMGRLAGGIAHDFNNMLTVIRGHAEMVLSRLEPPDGPVAQSVEQIRQAAERSTELTGQLLAFSRQQQASPEVVDLDEVVGELVPMLDRLIGEEIELAYEPAGGLWPVRIDRSQVGQILSNLCINAKDAIEGTGSIVVETQNVEIDETEEFGSTLLPAGHYARLTVSDDGRGMKRDVLDRIFEPFFTTKPAGEGTGLGLATVYGIVKQAGGFINAYSEPGEGTRFSIYVPRHAGDGAEAAESSGTGASERPVAHSTERPAADATETILLVEDEETILALCREVLERLGYRVIALTDSAEALEQARGADHIDLLLTDVVMPGINGRQLAERVLELHPEAKVLLMSGYTTDVVARRGVLAGEWSLIEKPFTPTNLATAVRNRLDS